APWSGIWIQSQCKPPVDDRLIATPHGDRSRRRVAWAVALFVISCWIWIAPPSAVGQILGSLIVTITSPESGATVSASITVSATVTVIGSVTVAGVQFKLDGANLGAEDTSAPYAISWNTATTSNGS